jgi:hypothetical protein
MGRGAAAASGTTKRKPPPVARIQLTLCTARFPRILRSMQTATATTAATATGFLGEILVDAQKE